MNTPLTKRQWIAVAAVVVILIVVVAALAARPHHAGLARFHGGMAPRGPMAGPPAPPPGLGPTAPAAAAVVVADGVVYVAEAGKLMAFEARTLKPLAEATLAARPGGPESMAPQPPEPPR